MLQIRNLSITHKKDFRVILQDFSCVLNPGDKAVIIGEEGNGKSTLLKWIYKPELIDDYAEADGGRIVNTERLAYLPQELSKEDEPKSLYEFFCGEACFFEKTPRELGALAGGFGLAADFFYGEQTMRTLSGGEKVKAQMMRLLLADPTVLLLDEPSNDIDIYTLEWLEKMISGWPGIVLFISHDETLIERTANMVIHIEQIKRKTVSRYTVARVPYQQYRKERGAAFARQEQQAAGERREMQNRQERFRKIYQKVEHEQEVITRQNPGKAAMLKKKIHTMKSMERRLERDFENMTQTPEEEEAVFFKLGGAGSAIPAGKTVLDFSLDRLYTPDRGRVLAQNIALKIRGSQKICITGKNGAGKTTLLKMIAGQLLEREDICAEYMPQNYEDLLPAGVTPVDFLDRTGEKQERTRIRTFLGALKYTADEMAHPIAELSGGQKAKVLLLKMSMSGANVLILDEPTRNFSPMSGAVIRKMIAAFPGAVISISHDRKYMSEACDRIYLLTEGGLKESGS